MALLDLYNSWTFRQSQVVNATGGTRSPREQASGIAATDFLSNEYQTEVRNRTPGDKVVVQATGDDTTTGTFKPISALKRYSALVGNSLLTTFRSKVVHKYNAQGVNPNDKYITSDGIAGTPGALNSSQPSN